MYVLFVKVYTGRRRRTCDTTASTTATTNNENESVTDSNDQVWTFIYPLDSKTSYMQYPVWQGVVNDKQTSYMPLIGVHEM